MEKKTGADHSMEERMKLLTGMQERVRTQMKGEEKVYAARREELLGSRELKEVAYGFKMSSMLNEDQAMIVLSALGQIRYAGRKDFYNIYETDYGGDEFEVELRWPQHYAGWVDSVKICGSEHSPKADLGVRFWRPAQEIESAPEQSEQEAQEIYQQLEQLLRKKQPIL